MGWRTAKAQMAAGNYKLPIDEGGSFMEGFASTAVPMISDAIDSVISERAEKRKIELKEKLLREREALKAARKKDDEAKDNLEDVKEATSWLSFHGIPINEENINGAIAAADNVGGTGTARWSKLTTHYSENTDSYTWAGGVERDAPEEVTSVEADDGIVDPAMSDLTPQVDDLEATEETTPEATTADEETSSLMEPVEEPTTTPASATEEEDDPTGFLALGIDPESVQFVSYTADAAESDPTATPVAKVGTGFGYKPKKEIPTAFKEAEIDISSITSYKEWLAASQELKMQNSLMTKEQQGEWNEYGKRLFDMDNSTELDFSNLNSLSDVAGWEQTYRAKMGAAPDAELPASISSALDNIRTVIEAENDASMDAEQRVLSLYMKQPEFKKLTPNQQANFIQNYDLLSKPNYETVEEARAALQLAWQMQDASNYNRIDRQIQKFEASPRANKTQTGYRIVDKNGSPVLESVQYYERDGKLYDGITNEALSGNVIENLPETSLETWRGQAAGIRNYNKDVASYISLSLTMQDIIDVASIDEASLSTVAGIMKTVQSWEKEANTFASLILNQPDGKRLTLGEMEQQARAKGILGPNETLDSLTSPERLSEVMEEVKRHPEGTEKRTELVGRLKRILDAKFAIAQFQVGAAEGQSSTAMSNTDREQFRMFLSGFKDVDSLATNYATYMSTRLAALQAQGSQYGPMSDIGQQFYQTVGAYPTAGASTVREQFEKHEQSDRLMFIFNNIMAGQLKESPDNKYRTGSKPAETSVVAEEPEAKPEQVTATQEGDNTPETRDILSMDDTAFNALMKSLEKEGGGYDFSSLSNKEITDLQKRYSQSREPK